MNALKLEPLKPKVEVVYLGLKALLKPINVQISRDQFF